ncbi:MAG: nitrate- and nitrite sensing domain-containing protein, partial [Sulfurimonas sp.]|nr:nitrate- and nitrite sensing domain-containing protein [Sulfurimonas sp.]
MLENYDTSKAHKKILVYTDLIKKSSSLIHELQIERGLSSSYLNSNELLYFRDKLENHRKITDKSINLFKVN